MSSPLFKGKVAIITGASSGIGRATALAFAEEGAKVAASDINSDEGMRTVALIRERGGVAEFFKADVARDQDVKSLVEQTVKTFGRLDIAYNNAGIEGELCDTTTCTEHNWDRVINTNLKGVWLCMKYEIPEMLKHGGGAIVNCSSVAGLVGVEGIPAYVASKHGVVGLTKIAALEYAKKNIRVNAVCPGAVETPMLKRFMGSSEEAEQTITASEPIGRIGKPEEVASAVLWLASENASFVTGQAHAIDGGWVAR